MDEFEKSNILERGVAEYLGAAQELILDRLRSIVKRSYTSLGEVVFNLAISINSLPNINVNFLIEGGEHPIFSIIGNRINNALLEGAGDPHSFKGLNHKVEFVRFEFGALVNLLDNVFVEFGVKPVAPDLPMNPNLSRTEMLLEIASRRELAMNATEVAIREALACAIPEFTRGKENHITRREAKEVLEHIVITPLGSGFRLVIKDNLPEVLKERADWVLYIATLAQGNDRSIADIVASVNDFIRLASPDYLVDINSLPKVPERAGAQIS